MCIELLRRLQYLRLGWVRVQVDALQVEDVILGVVAVVQRVVTRNGKRVVEGGLDTAKQGAGRCGREDRGGNSKELHLVVCLVVLCVVYQWRPYGVP